MAFRAPHLTLDSIFLPVSGATSVPSPIEDDPEPPDLIVPVRPQTIGSPGREIVDVLGFARRVSGLAALLTEIVIFRSAVVSAGTERVTSPS